MSAKEQTELPGQRGPTGTRGRPRLTFACELDPVRLTELFAGGSVIAGLQALRARVALMLSDLTAERAAVVQQLNAAGIPAIAIPQGFLHRLRSFDREKAMMPPRTALIAALLRVTLRGILWASARPWSVLAAIVVFVMLLVRGRRSWGPARGHMPRRPAIVFGVM